MGAAENFLTFLDPEVRSWTILYQQHYHSAIVNRLAAHPRIAECVEIDALATKDLGVVTADPLQGVIQFLVRDESLFDRASSDLSMLTPLERLEPHRWRACLDVTDRNFDTLFAEDQAEITAGCRAALAHVGDANRFRVTTGHGTMARELHVQIPSDRAWMIGDARSGNDYQLPAGEIANEPIAVSGELDLAGWPIGTLPFGLKYGRLSSGDCIAWIDGSRVVGLDGSHVKFCRDLDLAFERLPGLRRVVEFGIGTNEGVRRAAERHRLGYVWHEKRRGVHLGLGAELSDFGPTSRRLTAHHVDFVLDDATLSVT